MTTRRLFEENVKTQRFEAKVLSCTEEKGKYRIELDATAFFPEGGGQPGDQGELFPGLNEYGEPVRVLDTREKAGAIYHVTDKAIPEGTEVLGRLNWDKRLRNMQNHSGEHILSGLIHAKYGYNNVGFHMGSDAVTLDLDGVIVPEELPEFERQVNEVIEKNVEIEILYPSREELENIDYRSKKEIAGPGRLVTTPGADVCACCGTHTAATGAVGQIKILAAENYKGGVRLSIVCGERALLAAQAMRQRQADIGALLSAKPSETAHAVHRVFDEYTALKFAHFGLCSQLFEALAAQTAPGEDAIRIVPGLDPDGLHRLAVKLSEATTGLCAALTANEKGTGYCLARADGDVRTLTKALNAALNGRGGGKPGICQGSCAAAPEQVERFLKENHIL